MLWWFFSDKLFFFFFLNILSFPFQDPAKTYLINSTFKSGTNETKAASRISGLFLSYVSLLKLVSCLKIRLISHSLLQHSPGFKRKYMSQRGVQILCMGAWHEWECSHEMRQNYFIDHRFVCVCACGVYFLLFFWVAVGLNPVDN